MPIGASRIHRYDRIAPQCCTAAPSSQAAGDILQRCRCLNQRNHGCYHRKTGNNDIGKGNSRPGGRNSNGDPIVYQLLSDVCWQRRRYLFRMHIQTLACFYAELKTPRAAATGLWVRVAGE